MGRNKVFVSAIILFGSKRTHIELDSDVVVNTDHTKTAAEYYRVVIKFGTKLLCD